MSFWVETNSRRWKHSSQKDKIFLIPEQWKNSWLIAAGNCTFDKNTHQKREEEGETMRPTNIKGKGLELFCKGRESDLR